MWRLILAILAVISIANGLYMLLMPEAWYHSVPGVPTTGPLNLHFVPDIAMIFLVSGGAMAYGAWASVASVAITGAAWPALHAVFHLQIWFARGMPFDQVALVNLVAIQFLAWLALIAAWQLAKSAKGVRQ